VFGKKCLGSRKQWESFEAEMIPLMPDLYRVAVWLTKNKTEAEDLVQETLFQALKSFHRYRVGTNSFAWLTKIMYHLNLKRLRKSRLTESLDYLEEKTVEIMVYESSIYHKLTDKEIIDALKKLPEPFLQVVLLSDVEELSYKEIAEILDIPIGTVMSRLARGRKMLRQQLAHLSSDGSLKKVTQR
jgi:RNA polymerase sigma-70 factor (ECF subfamily)